jgi:hypothetical protein
VPDFFARQADGSGVVIDVRPDDQIQQADAEAFDATARACAEVGRLFRRVGTPDPVLVANLRWPARYRHARCNGRRDVVASLVGVFAQPTGLRHPLCRSADTASGCLVGPRQITSSVPIRRILDEIEING